MLHTDNEPYLDPKEFAALGTDAVAYMREISATEVTDIFPDAPELEADRSYWALFAANGDPIMLADQAADVKASAFYNELLAILPN